MKSIPGVHLSEGRLPSASRQGGIRQRAADVSSLAASLDLPGRRPVPKLQSDAGLGLGAFVLQRTGDTSRAPARCLAKSGPAACVREHLILRGHCL